MTDNELYEAMAKDMESPLAARVAELEGIVGKLPKDWFTRDGKLIEDGMELYLPDGRLVFADNHMPTPSASFPDTFMNVFQASDCYSTRAAAEAAKCKVTG